MRPPPHSTHSSRGVTLVELVIAIVIFGIAATALLGAMSAIAKNSAERMIRDQAESIATAYLQRVASATFTSIPTYNGTSTGAQDQFGNPVAGLDQYQITVSSQNINGLGSPAVPLSDAYRIDVSVSHPSGIAVTMSAFRTRHP